MANCTCPKCAGPEPKAPAREWWLIFENGYSNWISSKPLYSGDTTEEVHVIEHSAYLALEAEKQSLKEEIAALREITKSLDTTTRAPANLIRTIRDARLAKEKE